MKEKRKKYLELFLTFLKIGAFTFGGGYAMVSMIQQEIAERKKWLSKEELLDMVAIAESTPGPIAINSATFVGYKHAGVAGSFFATFGVVLPCFVIISIISVVLNQFKSLPAIQYAFEGIRVGVVVLIGNAFLSMWKSCKKSVLFYVLIVLSFLTVVFFDISSIFIIICGALLGIVLTYAGVLETREGK